MAPPRAWAKMGMRLASHAVGNNMNPAAKGNATMRYMLGIDVGGTFTDFVAYDRDTRQVKVWKSLSAPKNPVDGIMAGLNNLITEPTSPISGSARLSPPTRCWSARARPSPMLRPKASATFPSSSAATASSTTT